MKILFLTHYYPPEGNAPASRVSSLVLRWVKEGHEVTVLTCAPNVPDGVVYKGYENRWRQTESVDGVTIIRVWTYIAPNKGTARRIANYLSFMFSSAWHGLWLKKPDIIIATSPQFFCGWSGVLLHWLRRIPFILEIRDIWPESISAVEVGIPAFMLRIIEVMEKIMYRSADHIVTVGQGYVEKLVERKVPAAKISVIMNGVDKTLFYPRSPVPELLKQWKLDGKFICSYVGTIGMACGLLTVLEAAAQLKAINRNDIILVLVGDGAQREALETEAKLRSLDNVIFTGRRPKSEIPDWISSSNVNLVHLKKTDLFTTVMPSKIFESAGCARPVLLGVEGFSRNLVMEAEAGIPMEPENAADMVKGLITLADDPELCRRLGDNAFRNIAARYDRDTQAKDYLSILNKYL